ncbi:hypothetical protein [Massilia yuzhufengensis]|uniref:Uncharacterized protein n=1 Tax=Massilia yuzhufengensis TaxID=1164594 RepID=A0A1I1F0F9_9BURK|nr:hypothetical protein [Massilia yuzhufengensis]SFB92382.1 hypothetical protein SAMN05216204_102302 [Massilia yuzhufengensis]
MHPVIFFNSRLFDLAHEPENPHNDAPGKLLLDYVRERFLLAPVSEPIPEDWGWCGFVQNGGRSYMLGAILQPGDDGNHGCIIQLDKQRAFTEKLFGKAALAPDDPVLGALLKLIRDEPAFTDLSLNT